MSTITVTDSSAPAPARTARPEYKVTGRRVLRSEWAKLWSLRSTWITLGLGLLFLVAFGVIAAAHYKSQINSGGRLRPDDATATALSLSVFGTNFAQLALGVLGVLVTARRVLHRHDPLHAGRRPAPPAGAVVQVGGVRPGRPRRLHHRRLRRVHDHQRDRLRHPGGPHDLPLRCRAQPAGRGSLPGPGRRDRHRPGRPAALGHAAAYRSWSPR